MDNEKLIRMVRTVGMKTFIENIEVADSMLIAEIDRNNNYAATSINTKANAIKWIRKNNLVNDALRYIYSAKRADVDKQYVAELLNKYK